MIVGQMTEVDGVLVPSSRLVEHGTQQDTLAQFCQQVSIQPIMIPGLLQLQ